MRALLLVLIFASARADEPVLHVKARTRIDIQSVTRVPGGVVVKGALFDSALDEPIPGRTVAIAVDGPNGFYRYAEPTSDDGTFRWRVPLAFGTYSMRLAAGGDEEYAPAPVVERNLDVLLSTPQMTLIAPETVSVTQDQIQIAVEVKEPRDENDGDTALELPITLFLDGKPLSTGVTRFGRLDFQLPVHELGAPGTRVTVSARFDGDRLRNPAQASRVVRVTTPTTLTLSAEPERISADDEVRFSGLLSDASGPVESGVIDLTLGKKTLASAVSERDGRFTIRLRGADLGMGHQSLEASFRTSGYREASHAGPVELVVHGASFKANPIYLVPPIVTALALLGMSIARRRPWVGVAQKLRARITPPPPSSGLSEGRTRVFRTLMPAGDFGLAGQVCDSATLQPIAAATLVVDVGGQHRSAVSDENGRFALESLPAGTLAVEVAAAGYVSERFHRTVPHRGELRGARVLLVPIRARIFAAWDRAARPLAPKPASLEVWTPRELLEHMKKQKLITDDLAKLTHAVERHCYGPFAPNLEALAEVEKLVAGIGHS